MLNRSFHSFAFDSSEGTERKNPSPPAAADLLPPPPSSLESSLLEPPILNVGLVVEPLVTAASTSEDVDQRGSHDDLAEDATGSCVSA